jgi:hypothetical protein
VTRAKFKLKVGRVGAISREAVIGSMLAASLFPTSRGMQLIKTNLDLEKMDDYVEEITGLFSLQLYEARACDAIVGYAEKCCDWSDAAIGEERAGNYQSAVRPEYRWASTFSPSGRSAMKREFDRKVTNALGPIIRETWRSDLDRLAGTHIVRYQPGGFYVSHADAGLDLNDRYFTVLCYLNDEFRGGQTSFPTLGFSVTPQKGKAILFPSTYLHRAEPVLEGTKYILVSWLMGPDPPKWI